MYQYFKSLTLKKKKSDSINCKFSKINILYNLYSLKDLLKKYVPVETKMNIFPLKNTNNKTNKSQTVNNWCFRMNSQYHLELLACKRKILCTSPAEEEILQ